MTCRCYLFRLPWGAIEPATCEHCYLTPPSRLTAPVPTSAPLTVAEAIELAELYPARPRKEATA